MQTSIEFFLLANFVFDAGILFIVSKCTGFFNLRRILFSAAVCTLYALLASYRSSPWPSPVFQMMFLIPLSMLATGSVDIKHWGSCTLMLAACAFITGGLSRFLRDIRSMRSAALTATVTGISILYALNISKLRKRDCWTISIRIIMNGTTVTFPALIDTGNRLHEPLSGLPVIIAEADVVADILPVTGYRDIAFGGLGGNGTLKCFRPDSVWIVSGKKTIRTPDVWVAVCETRLPGINSALAPSSFASL